MPQLDFATYASQLFWLAVFFTLLYVALCRFILPKMRHVIEERATLEADCLKVAETLMQEAEGLKKAYEQEVLRVRQQAAAQIDKAVASIEKETAKKHAELEQRLVEERKRTDARMRVLKGDLMREMGPATHKVAAALYKKLAGKAATASDIDAYVSKRLDITQSNKE
jgi:F-type H+-transporting ATPase subunit b